MKILKKLILLSIIAAIAGVYYYNSSISSAIDPNDDSAISFQVKSGQTAKDVAESLKAKDLIKSPTTFYLYSRLNDLDSKIIAGRFILNKTMDTPTILETLTDKTQGELILTIQEGLTAEDIQDKLLNIGALSDNQSNSFIQAIKDFNDYQSYSFLDKSASSKLTVPLEGFLYPDTYFLDSMSFQPSDVIYLTLNNFEKKWDFIDKTNSKLDQYSVQDIVTMASIIETEVFGEEDRKMVAGIFWKRLENGWTLGADSTLLYVTHDRHISATDLALDSPYNTRKNLGLPPGPIANPSIESIEAALFPTETDYWFYLTTLDTGEVIYSKTNEEHNQNKAKYL